MYQSGVELLTWGGGCTCVDSESIWKIPVPSSHCCCKPKTSLKHKVCLKDDDDNDDDVTMTVQYVSYIKIHAKNMYPICKYMGKRLGEKNLINFLLPKGLDIYKLLFKSPSTQRECFSILQKVSTIYDYSECD